MRKAKNRCWATRALLLAAVLSACGPGTPPVSEAKGWLEERIATESEGRMRLVAFDKTNGQRGKLAGIEMYFLEYEAVVGFTEDCKWLTSHAYSGKHETFETVQTVEQSGKKGYWGKWLNITQTPGTEHKKGERASAAGKITFELTENGWRAVSY